MSKYVYIQDSHCQGVNSANRIGDYFSDWLIKFEEVLNLAKDNNCEAILDGGDLTETKNPTYNVLDQIADRVETIGIPIYSIYGNHCLNNGHLVNSANTGMAHLQKRSKLFHYFEQIESTDYIIKPVEYFYGVEEQIKKEGIVVNFEDQALNINKDPFRIAVVHAMITPTKFFDNASYVIPEQIETNADLVLVAHYHTPWKKEIGKTTYLDIGCMGRLNINEAKIVPSCLLLDTNKRSYDVIPLKSAKPAEQVFDLSRYNEKKAKEQSIDSFLASLKGTEWITLDIVGQIEKMEVEDKVKQYMLDRIAKVKEENNGSKS